MPVYSFNNSTLKKIEKTTFNDEGILERQHLQSALKHQIETVAPNCLVIAEELSEWSDSLRRIDLLAIDRSANLVVIELKRTEKGEHMELQALRYAAMVSTLTFARAVEIFQQHLSDNETDADAKTKLLEFLGWDEPQEDQFGMDVRIVLVSANFSKELTTSVIWLNERSLDIRCVRMIPYKHDGQILIDVQQIIPLPEAESYQVKIKQQSEERRVARQSSKDYTRYQFMGSLLNKRRLVLAVIQQWLSEHSPNTIDELLVAFPQKISSGLFVTLDEAEATYSRHGLTRHFLGEGEVITFPDESQYAISNQWGKGNLAKFIAQAKNLGYEIAEEG
ncbi:hypothetical protein GCM10023116_48130 [Kistimonas scapharcae]|uniref:DUF91 domain-containing protein n=1 Tax=Kistimonas scapharcae TaxID=1036133 RepID=A0ABP8VAW4_9GAMM